MKNETFETKYVAPEALALDLAAELSIICSSTDPIEDGEEIG